MAALVCRQSGHEIPYGSTLLAITTRAACSYHPIRGDLINQLPPKTKRQGHGFGVDIHRASSERGPDGKYTEEGRALGDFLFSLTKEDVMRYFPKFAARHLEDLLKEI